ncbi:MAG: hypothetical protein K2G36_08730 [Ruminococcus sp.]|nr:hypothetical protein [Ruminococcus sp.]
MTNKILFCKIKPMKYYKGVTDDEPVEMPEGFDYLGEQYNFKYVIENGKKICRGYFENHGNNVLIENIDENAKLSDLIDDVLVVWFARYEGIGNLIVGWYKHATVYRHLQKNPDWYYITANIENCVLLSEEARKLWKVPYSKKDGYGFGMSNIWYAREEKAENYVESLIKRINNYNWIDKYPVDFQKGKQNV